MTAKKTRPGSSSQKNKGKTVPGSKLQEEKSPLKYTLKLSKEDVNNFKKVRKMINDKR